MARLFSTFIIATHLTVFDACLQVSLLDSKRSMNVGIFLRQFKT